MTKEFLPITISQAPKNDDEAIAYLATLNGAATEGRSLYQDTEAVYVGRYLDEAHKESVALRWRWVGWDIPYLVYEVEPW